MKKILLGGTALVAAALAAAAPASADEKPVTSGLSINITGFVAWEAGLIIGSSDDGRDREYDFNSNGRLQFDIKNVTDSGLEYGARIRMNNVNRRQDVTVDRQYVYLKGEFGTLTLGDSPQVAGDFGYFFAPDDILNAQGGYGDGLDGNYRYGGGNFFSLDPTYQSGLDKSTSIKYSSPSIGGFIFAVGFTPVISDDKNLSNGTQGRADLFNGGQVYENAISGGIGYEGEFDGTSVKVRGTASYANGVDNHFDLETYSAGGQVGFGGIVASVVWVGTPSGFGTGATDKAFNTVGLGLGYSLGALNFGLGYAYTWADKNNDLTQDAAGNAFDLKDNHIATATVNYTLAPGLNTYAEVIYEIQNFRKQDIGGGLFIEEDKEWEQATFLTGVSVSF
ncbi:porin [Inquilinus sp. Marseille-Q2685]|uniref:porin n=1 Tax=Inquilinus sp. Marseille-Q2685 TaxID=2866581 RepID=UPI001CE3B799|nr:porin [Inquilinus sp. Marseille-Q2685]